MIGGEPPSLSCTSGAAYANCSKAVRSPKCVTWFVARADAVCADTSIEHNSRMISQRIINNDIKYRAICCVIMSNLSVVPRRCHPCRLYKTSGHCIVSRALPRPLVARDARAVRVRRVRAIIAAHRQIPPDLSCQLRVSLNPGPGGGSPSTRAFRLTSHRTSRCEWRTLGVLHLSIANRPTTQMLFCSAVAKCVESHLSP
jgi:hypothetical protein